MYHATSRRPAIFSYHHAELYCEQAPLARIAAEVGTPCHVYSRRQMLSNLHAVQNALRGCDALICYALKANANPTLLTLLAQEGCGADVVSGGELHLALRAGISPKRIVYAGVGKTDAEIELALRQGILAFNVESFEELHILSALVTRLGTEARVAVRVNPDIDASTHPYISTALRANKFGIHMERAEEAFGLAAALPGLVVEGVHCHLGSMIMEAAPYVQAAASLAALVRRLRSQGIVLKHVDIGGGLGVDYTRVVDEGPALGEAVARPATPGELFAALLPILAELGLRVLFEPGRYIVANAGALLARVILTKESPAKKFVVVDAGMNDLIRPCLYHAHHQIVPVRESKASREVVDVVGPICESADFLAQERSLAPVARGDLVAVMATGAYGYAQSSNYNGRPRPPEVLVEGEGYRVIRERERIEDLWRLT